jgi:hypothetical protein
MNSRMICACAAFALAAAPCIGVAQSWNGTWKLNEAKSKLSGTTFTYSDKGNGMMHYSDGSFDYDYACDGKPYTTLPNSTVTCTGSPQTGYDYVYKTDGKVTGNARRTFSANGTIMTVHGTDTRPDGTTAEWTNVNKRLSGTNGIVGKWINTKAESVPDVVVIETKGNWIKFYVPAYKATIEGNMDGSQLAMKGPTIPPGLTTTYKSEGSNKLRSTTSLNGKLTGEELMTLSADGKTFTDENWAPGKMNEKTVGIYERQ